jgi:dihydropyrimidinase
VSARHVDAQPRAVGIEVARNAPLGSALDLVVSDATVVSPRGTRREDVGIRDGRIVAVGDLAGADARSTLDAGGLLAFPGLIDAHVHPTYLDGPRDCSIAALCGGVTTTLNFAYAGEGESLVGAISHLRDVAARASLVDFGIHGALLDPERQVAEIPAAADLGVSTFKVFLAYAAQGWMSDDFALGRVMQEVSGVGGLLLAHCENGAAIDLLEQRSARDGRSDDPRALGATRPPLLEAEAVNRVVTFGEVFDCAVFIVHVTSREALEVVRRGRTRGVAMAAETCPQYLALSEGDLERWGQLAKIGPPLRSDEDRRSLWAGLCDRTLQTIGSDHVPKKDASAAPDAFGAAGFGAPSIETMLAVVYDAGVAAGLISAGRLAELTAENPARIFGLWPRKGAIQPGADADLVLWDPDSSWTVSREELHTRSGYSLYEGRRLRGRHAATIRGGRVVARGSRLVEDGMLGAFLPTGRGDLLQDDPPRMSHGAREGW